MSTASILYTGRIQGQTSAGVAVATQNPVTLHSDGYMRWSDANGRPRSVKLDGDLAQLLRFIFTGAGGITHAVTIGTAAT
jgi:hypothetical protein